MGRALREGEFLQAVLDSTEDVVFVKDRDGRYLLMNRAGLELGGKPAEQILGHTDAALFPGEPPERLVQVREDDLGVIVGGRTVRFEEAVITPLGRRYFMTTKCPYRGADGRILGVVGVARDITERRDAEDALKQADRRKDEFLAMLAHELRNPLSALANALHVARSQEVRPERRRWAEEVMARQLRQLTRMVDDLLDVSRITRGKIQLTREPIDLAEVIPRATQVVAPLIESRRHALSVIVRVVQEEAPLLMEADPARMEQVLVNLLTNAAKYTPEGGKIRLSAGREGESIVVRVADTGIGIPPEMLSTVFDLFIQVDRSLDRSQGGLGIGLTLVKRLVEMHGGAVSIESEVGKGTELILRLPALPAAPEHQRGAPRAEAAVATPKNLRVLVVDDNVDSAQGLGMFLEMFGYQVELEYEGAAAVEKARSWAPDVVLLDIGLPGKDGYQVARELRGEPALARAVLVAVSGYGQEQDRRRAREAGFHRHLVKPVDHDALLSFLAGLAGV